MQILKFDFKWEILSEMKLYSILIHFILSSTLTISWDMEISMFIEINEILCE